MVILGDGNVFQNFENGGKESSSIFLISCDVSLKRSMLLLPENIESYK